MLGNGFMLDRRQARYAARPNRWAALPDAPRRPPLSPPAHPSSRLARPARPVHPVRPAPLLDPKH